MQWKDLQVEKIMLHTFKHIHRDSFLLHIGDFKTIKEFNEK